MLAIRRRACGPGLLVTAAFIGPGTVTTASRAGAGLGLEALTGVSHRVWAVAVGVSAAAVLASGIYRVIERVLIVMVVLMSVVFVLTAIIVRPDVGGIVSGMFVPTLPAGSLVTVIALIGTTVVPYNLFLHASAVREKWPASVSLRDALREARLDTGLSVTLGDKLGAGSLTKPSSPSIGTPYICCGLYAGTMPTESAIRSCCRSTTREPSSISSTRTIGL